VTRLKKPIKTIVYDVLSNRPIALDPNGVCTRIKSCRTPDSFVDFITKKFSTEIELGRPIDSFLGMFVSDSGVVFVTLDGSFSDAEDRNCT
jgi:hypothetical protein